MVYEKGNRQWTKTTSPWCVQNLLFAMYNTLDEVHKVYEAMKNIMEGKIKYAYKKVGDAYVPDIDEKQKCQCMYDTYLKPLVEP